MESLELLHGLIDLSENKLLDRSPIEHEPFEDFPLYSEVVIVKRLMFLRDIRDLFEECNSEGSQSKGKASCIVLGTRLRHAHGSWRILEGRF